MPSRVRESTQADYKRLFSNHIRPALGHMKAADVTFADVHALHRKLTAVGPYCANRTIAVLSAVFNFAIKHQLVERNPAKGIGRNPEHARRRYLSSDELLRLTAALAAHADVTAANVIRILLMTGARKGEVLSMRWENLDLGAGTWTKPASSTKQKREHRSILSAPARLLLAEIREAQAQAHSQLPEYVFQGRYGKGNRKSVKRDWEKLLRAADIRECRLHDIRHTYASLAISSGHSLPLIGALLGHSNVQTTARYAHLIEGVEREAVEKIAKLINAGNPSTMAQESGEVITLKGR